MWRTTNGWSLHMGGCWTREEGRVYVSTNIHFSMIIIVIVINTLPLNFTFF